ncbi:X-ray repair cross-complementing protein 5 [Diachasma alloeum]|uniref:X-ray repair cross-complementing protein 5 n=1 Tax=Diachasma alloeum TaxID=454923 RepID=UPI0007382086|nr:X-ray repair cross-complementing protein 5 [Diachasma alloeum]
MGPKKEQGRTVFIINVAVPSKQGLDNDYLKNAKELVRNMVEKMIFNTPRSEAGIVLIGVENDSGPLGMMNLQEIQTVSWDMVKKIEEIQSYEGVFSKWLGGFKAALNVINEAYGELRKSKIVLISDFPPDPSQTFKQFEGIVEKFKENGIELICGGTKDLNDVPREELNTNEQKILEFCKKVESRYRPLDYMLKESRFYDEERTRFCPWNCDLEIHTIRIPIRVAVRASKNEMKKPWGLMSIATEDGTKKEAPQAVERKKELVDRNTTVHAKEDTVKGYMCGKTFIPVTEADEQGMELPFEEKSFKLYGVTNAETVLFRYRTGPSTWLVLPQEGYEEPFFYFLKVMGKLNLVALVRRVYQNGGKNPTINSLTPCIQDPELPWCFVMHQLIFTEEESRVDVQSLDSVIPNLTKKEKDAVGDLIDAMFVGNDGEEPTEQFIRAPERQHLWNIKAFRALHPDEPLPPPKDYLMARLEPPKSIDMAEVNSCMERLINLFELKPEEVVQVVQEKSDMEVDGVNEIPGNLEKGNSQGLPVTDKVMIEKTEKNTQDSQHLSFNVFDG